MAAMKVFNLQVEIAKQEDGLWRATVPGLQGCWVDAETLHGALTEIQEVAAMIIDHAQENNEDLPPSVTPASDVSFSARIPLDISEHEFARKPRRPAKSPAR